MVTKILVVKYQEINNLKLNIRTQNLWIHKHRMSVNKIYSNTELANLWLKRAIKDFNVFKKLVHFDSKTNKVVRTSDPALAVYLLQQSIEKTTKAAAIASGQFSQSEISRYYSHNSLGLIVSLYNKLIVRTHNLGLESVFAQMTGLNLATGEEKLNSLEGQVMGKESFIDKKGQLVQIRAEAISLTPKAIDRLLDVMLKSRRLILEITNSVFKSIPQINIDPESCNSVDLEKFLKQLRANLASQNTALTMPTDEQLNSLTMLIENMEDLGLEPVDLVKRQDIITNHLGSFALSFNLLILSYLTFAHESTTRYPLDRPSDILKGKIGCEDYDSKLGIVNRIGRVGYVAGLTINDMRNQIDSLSLFFAMGT